MIKHEFKQKEVNVLHHALNMCGLNIGYEQADLINEVLEVLSNKGDQMNIEDSVRLKMKWQKKWEDYHEANK